MCPGRVSRETYGEQYLLLENARFSMGDSADPPSKGLPDEVDIIIMQLAIISANRFLAFIKLVF